jgi:predicted dehydrogenase
MAIDGRIIALIGGGRWGRVHATNLFRLLTPRDRVLWVSQFNTATVADIIASFALDGPTFEICRTLDEALADRPDAALVITAPDTHFAVAESCLLAGLHVFVEKPLAFRQSEARRLIDLAEQKQRVLGVGLHLLSATYLKHFRAQIADAAISRIAIRWFDPVQEQRYGETKFADHSVPLPHDIYPHIWSIVRALTDCEQQTIVNAGTSSDGTLSIVSTAGAVSVESVCGRNAVARERSIQITFQNRGVATLDFTKEPGHLTRDGVVLPPDPLWGKSPTPAMAEVKEFLHVISRPLRNTTWPHLAARCVDSVAGAETIQGRLG